MSQPPKEVQVMIEQFEAEEEAKQKRKAAEKALKKAANPHPETLPRKQMTSKDMEQLAIGLGCKIESGNGRHGKHIIAPNRRAVSLPDHPGNLSRGVSSAIQKFLREYGQPKD